LDSTRPIAAALLLAAALAPSDDHLVAGARLFRDGNFEQAYVEFRVAERLGAAEGAWYAAAALQKLERNEDAVEAFAHAEAAAPSAGDALLDYYRALACHGARLYLCADRLLEGLGGRAGPKLLAQADKIRQDIARLFGTPPGKGAIDAAFDRGRAAQDAGRVALAAAFYEEAAALGARRPDRHREAEARKRMAAAREATASRSP
jgi:hypothetical protein